MKPHFEESQDLVARIELLEDLNAEMEDMLKAVSTLFKNEQYPHSAMVIDKLLARVKKALKDPA